MIPYTQPSQIIRTSYPRRTPLLCPRAFYHFGAFVMIEKSSRRMNDRYLADETRKLLTLLLQDASNRMKPRVQNHRTCVGPYRGRITQVWRSWPLHKWKDYVEIWMVEWGPNVHLVVQRTFLPTSNRRTLEFDSSRSFHLVWSSISRGYQPSQFEKGSLPFK